MNIIRVVQLIMQQIFGVCIHVSSIFVVIVCRSPPQEKMLAHALCVSLCIAVASSSTSIGLSAVLPHHDGTISVYWTCKANSTSMIIYVNGSGAGFANFGDAIGKFLPATADSQVFNTGVIAASNETRFFTVLMWTSVNQTENQALPVRCTGEGHPDSVITSTNPSTSNFHRSNNTTIAYNCNRAERICIVSCSSKWHVLSMRYGTKPTNDTDNCTITHHHRGGTASLEMRNCILSEEPHLMRAIVEFTDEDRNLICTTSRETIVLPIPFPVTEDMTTKGRCVWCVAIRIQLNDVLHVRRKHGCS